MRVSLNRSMKMFMGVVVVLSMIICGCGGHKENLKVNMGDIPKHEQGVDGLSPNPKEGGGGTIIGNPEKYQLWLNFMAGIWTFQVNGNGVSTSVMPGSSNDILMPDNIYNCNADNPANTGESGYGP